MRVRRGKIGEGETVEEVMEQKAMVCGEGGENTLHGWWKDAECAHTP